MNNFMTKSWFRTKCEQNFVDYSEAKEWKFDELVEQYTDNGEDENAAMELAWYDVIARKLK